MTLITTIPLLAVILGLLIYILAVNPKAAEAGRLLYACGVLVSLFQVAGHVFHLP